MQWDIFGKKKLDKIGQRQDAIIQDISDLKEVIKLLTQEINQLGQKKIVEIPLVKPIIRDAERAAKKEKKDKLEPDTINNLWKN